MARYQVPAFVGVVVLTLFTGLMDYGLAYVGASASFSDLHHYGIRYGTPAFSEIVSIMQRGVAWVGISLGCTNVLALIGWGCCLFHCTRKGDLPARRPDESA